MISVKNSKLSSLIPMVLIGLTMIIIGVSVATLVIVVKRLDASSASPVSTAKLSYVDQIKIDDLMKHLEQLQVIADQSSGTRAIATAGFTGTLDYITSQLRQNTDFMIQRQSFTVKNYIVQGIPTLEAQINDFPQNFIYLTDFTYMVFSARATFDSAVRLVNIPNMGCQDTDWAGVSARDAVALVKRGDCSFPDKSIIAEKNGVRGLLIYNDGTSSNGVPAIQGFRINTNSSIPVFFLSYNIGIRLFDALTTSGAMVNVKMNIDVSDAEGVANICADTKTGDETKTIVIGAHSDGVPAGSGINDNGSGTVGVLVLALNLARLFQTADYASYPYRVRFCWWGAEEIGLLGSIYHVEQAATNDRVGERLTDYLVNLNYDMLAGPNYRFGVHDGSLVPDTTPSKALNGTKRITDLFRQWFNDQKLPWSNASLGGGSDYVPFLARGLAVGGVNTGAGGIKSSAERDRYSAILGIGKGGLANAAFDPCYHQQCDRLQNINPFAYENVVKAAAHAIEYMGRLNDLEKWLYPEGRSIRLEPMSRYQLLKTDENLS